MAILSLKAKEQNSAYVAYLILYVRRQTLDVRRDSEIDRRKIINDMCGFSLSDG